MAVALNSTSRVESNSEIAAADPPQAEEAIRVANAELQRRAGSALELPFSVLVEQRDQALRAAESAREQAGNVRREMVEEEDRFIAFLMADHERQLAELQRELASLREGAERRRSLEPVRIVSVTSTSGSQPPPALGLTMTEHQIASLQERLQAAYAEVDDTRADAVRLQEERDEAVREISDVRFECQKQVDAARDEAVQLQWQLDDAERRLLDAADEARDEACTLSEQIDEVRRELDERNAEVRSLRARLATLDQAMLSRPPPAAALELENARKEAQLLRKSLIEAKRDASRLKNELDAVRARSGLAAPLEDGAANDRKSQIVRRP
jgi:chromosome segregation ATPase